MKHKRIWFVFLIHSPIPAELQPSAQPYSMLLLHPPLHLLHLPLPHLSCLFSCLSFPGFSVADKHYQLAANVIGSEARGTMRRAVGALKSGGVVHCHSVLSRRVLRSASTVLDAAAFSFTPHTRRIFPEWRSAHHC